MAAPASHLRIFGQRFGVGAQRVVDLHDALVLLFHDLRARFELVHLLRQIVRRERRVQKPHVFLRSAAATTLLAPPVQDPVVIRVELGALLLGLRPVRLKIDQVDRDAERALVVRVGRWAGRRAGGQAGGRAGGRMQPIGCNEEPNLTSQWCFHL